MQWDWSIKAPAEPTADEADAFQRLAAAVAKSGDQVVEATGPLSKDGGGWQLAVRAFA